MSVAPLWDITWPPCLLTIDFTDEPACKQSASSPSSSCSSSPHLSSPSSSKPARRSKFSNSCTFSRHSGVNSVSTVPHFSLPPKYIPPPCEQRPTGSPPLVE